MSYFRMPTAPRSLRLGQREIPAVELLVMLLIAGVSAFIYFEFLMPGYYEVQCGDVNDGGAYDGTSWKVANAGDGSTGAAPEAGFKENHEYWRGLGGGGTEPIAPECNVDGGRVPELYQRLTRLTPILLVIPLAMLVFQRVGTPGAAAAMLLAVVAREMIPGDGMADWLIMTVGMLAASIPLPVNGLLGALGHIGALLIWPTFAIGYMDAAEQMKTDGVLADPVLWVLELMLWLVLLGGLIIMPMVWGLRWGTKDPAG